MILTHRSFPRAILHVDGDSFFASCEVAKDPSLKGKCVVTGKERGIASSMSYEAKARGVTRAMRLSEIKKLIPDVIILPSDYETYSLYSQRMYEIVRRYTDAVEEYSIDECFADLTGMRRPNNMSYEAMAEKIKRELDGELGMTFSVGLALNKVTAKVASKWRKPSGLTIIPGYHLHLYLAKTPIEKIWGIGPQTSSYLIKKGVKTALDFAMKEKEWVKALFSKPFQEIHSELNGDFVYPLTVGEKHDYASISKTRTFTPPSKDRGFVYSQLSKNIENACIKLRRHNLFAKAFAFYLKTQDFRYSGLDFKLSQAVSVPQEILKIVSERFDDVYRPGFEYRATGVVLMELSHSDARTLDLFGRSGAIDRIKRVYEGVDAACAKFGKHAVFLGSSFRAMNEPAHRGDRADSSERRKNLVKGENERQRIGLPFLGVVK
ncbi:DNA polymerase IV [Patescibacteria group bacterium]|nr:DNA polymerase IV [Patescibacteria group bacterium]